MIRGILALGLIANGTLFGAGIWRSVMLGKPAFHRFGDMGGYQGPLSDIWIWPVLVILLSVLIALARTRKSGTKPDPAAPEQDLYDHE